MSRTLRHVLADHIKTLMSMHDGMTITSLAKDAGVSRGQINNIVTQNTDTKLDTLESIAKVFKVEPWFLLSSSGPDKPESLEKIVVQIGMDARGKRDKHLDLAGDVLTSVFTETDDEGRLSLLRMAVSLLGWSPDLEGIKMPRDWRQMLLHWAHDMGWLELYPAAYLGNEEDEN